MKVDEICGKIRGVIRTKRNWNDGPPVNPWCLAAITISMGVFFGTASTDWVELMQPSLYALIISAVVTKIVYSVDKKKWDAARAAEADENARKFLNEMDKWNRKWLGEELAAQLRQGHTGNKIEQGEKNERI